MINNPNFYPTPKELLKKMTDSIDFKYIKSVLEPSAGKGDIAEFIIKKHKEAHSYRGRYYEGENFDLDVIELDSNLQHILMGKKFRLVHNDFLTYPSMKRYDLIIMNPPFDRADEHLLQAIKMQEKGGKIVCLMNAETLKNPYSNTRKDLKRKLEELDAEVEFLKDSFTKAERKTNVEVAMIKIDIPQAELKSTIITGMKSEEQYKFYEENEEIGKDLVIDEFLKRIVEHYKFEVNAGVRFINEYHSMKPNFINSFKEDSFKKSILTLTIDGDSHSESNRDMINSYIKSVRYKYWETLFTSNQFNDLFTSALRTEYHNRISSLVDFDFSLYNIYKIQEEISKALTKSVDDSLIQLFDEFSHKHSWYDETSKNIHLYNGWKTNKSWKINKKVIIPLRSYSTWDKDRLEISYYDVVNKLTDIEKVLNYLGQGLVNHDELRSTLQAAQDRWREAQDSGDKKKIKAAEPKKIKLKYFMVSFFKKGTCHIEFTNQELLDRFNLYGSMQKGWLPPTYGKKEYADMSKTEQKVVDEFQGEAEYQKVMDNKELYLPEYTTINLMGKGLPALEQLQQPEEINVTSKVVQEDTDSNVSETIDVAEVLVSEVVVEKSGESEKTIVDAVDSVDDNVHNKLKVAIVESNEVTSSEISSAPIEKPDLTSTLGENVTLITKVEKPKKSSQPVKEIIIDAEDVEVVLPSAVQQVKEIASSTNVKTPLLLSAPVTEASEIIEAKPLEDNNTKQNLKELNIKDKEIKKKSKPEDTLPEFISINKEGKEGENVQLGFAI